MNKLFGTDGIRGLSNSYPITPDVITKIGLIVGHKFLNTDCVSNRVMIGKDTRLSSYMVEHAITAGLLASGMDVLLVGPVPTPAISFLTRSMRCAIGIMISASHNKYQDNGIKFFNKDGEKFDEELQSEIESIFASQDVSKFYCQPENIGRAKRIEGADGRYVEFVKKTFPQKESLSRIKVVVDCANGADYKIAPEVLWELGAEIITIGNQPNGKNINDKCGSTHIELLRENVIKEKADIGIALDGDGDRVIVIDELGNTVDGDQIICALAIDMLNRRKLTNKALAITIMSNLGLETYLSNLGLEVIRTPVGDKKVYDAMKKHNLMLGGEQSGHIILKKYSTTGDGLMVAVQLLALLKKSKIKASKLFNIFTPIEQFSSTISFSTKQQHDMSYDLNAIQNKYTDAIQGGRIVIRQSGTENIIRIMIEWNEDKTNLYNKIKSEIENYLKKNNLL